MSDATKALLERLRAATGADRALDEALAVEVAKLPATMWIGDSDLGNERRMPAFIPRYTSSLDDALALCERVLPKWRVKITQALGEIGWSAAVFNQQGHEFDCAGSNRDSEGKHLELVDWINRPGKLHAPTAPLSVLLALMTALLEQTT